MQMIFGRIHPNKQILHNTERNKGVYGILYIHYLDETSFINQIKLNKGFYKRYYFINEVFA